MGFNAFELFATLSLKSDDFDRKLNTEKDKFSKLGSTAKKAIGGMGKAVATIGKVSAAAIGAGAVAVGSLAKQAVAAYGQYEQLKGGVETLFGAQGMSMQEYAKSVGKSVDEIRGEYNSLIEAQEDIMEHADNAYKTAGLSANQYMETVTSFAASLNASLGGNTKESAKMADMAITDMADNANKMGTSMESIQNAYQGFAKQNYTMLDNLKLGYGGTKTEMERLLEDAAKLKSEKLGIDVEYDIESFADVVDAIHVIQDEMGITGTTAKEATETIQGSMGQMKSAWANLITGMADKNADLDKLMNNLVDSIAGYTDKSGKHVKGFLDNIIPVVEKALNSIATLIEKLAPKLAKMIPGLIQTLLPKILNASRDIVSALVENLPGIISTMLPSILSAVEDIIDQIIADLPTLIGMIADVLDQGLPLLLDGISKLIESIIENLPTIVEKLLPIILKALANIVQKIIEKLPEIFGSLTKAFNKIFEIMGQEIDKVIPGFSDAFAALKPVIMGVVGALVAYKAALAISTLISTVKKAMVALKAATEGETIAQTILNTVMNANPIMLVVTAIGFLVGAFIALGGNVEDIIGVFKGFFNFVKAGWENLVTSIEWVIEKIVGLFKGLVKFFKGAWDNIQESAEACVNAVGDFFTTAWELIKAVWNTVVGFFQGIWDGIVGVFTFVGDTLSGFFQTAWDLIVGIWQGAGEWFGKVWAAIKLPFEKVGEFFGNAFKAAWEKVTEWMSAIKEFAEKVIDGIKNALENLKEGIKEVLGIKATWTPASSGGLVPNLRPHATGGVVRKGEIALLEGTGAEAVVPLDQNKKWIHAVAQEFKAQGGGTLAGAGGDVIIPVYIGDERIQDVVVKASQLAQYRTGGR